MRHVMVRFICVGLLLAGVWNSGSVEATTVTGTVWADEAYTVYLSTSEVADGTLFLEGTGGAEMAQSGEIELVEGVTNYLHVRVKNDNEDACALIGSFAVGDGFVFSDNSQTASTLLETDLWRMSRVGFGPPYEFIQDLGSNGTSPWGTKEIPGQAPNYIGFGDGPGDYYFSLVISPAAFFPSENRYEYAILSQPFGGTSDSLELPLVGVFEMGTNRSISVTDPGRVGVRAEVSVDGATRDDNIVTVAEFHLGDFVFTGPGSEATVDLSLNLHLQGNFTAGAGNSEVSGENSMASSWLQLTVQVNEETPFTGRAIYEASQAIISKNPGTFVGSDISGFLQPLLSDQPDGDAGDFQAEFNFDVDQMITTPVYTVATGEPVRVSLEMEVAVTASSDGSRAMGAIHSALHFPYDGPVFNLPEGFTVTALSASIVENRFEGGGSGDSEKVLVPGLFMKAGNFAGESKAEGHEDWIDLIGVSSGLFRMTGDQIQPKVTFEDVEVTKYADKSSPRLIGALAQGINPGGMWCHRAETASSIRICGHNSSFCFTMLKWSTTGFSVVVNDPVQPVESFAFNYEEDRLDLPALHQCFREYCRVAVEANWDLVNHGYRADLPLASGWQRAARHRSNCQPIR